MIYMSLWLVFVSLNCFFRIVKIFFTVFLNSCGCCSKYILLIFRFGEIIKISQGQIFFSNISLCVCVYVLKKNTCSTSQTREGGKSALYQKVYITFLLSSTKWLLQGNVLFSCYFRQTALTADAFLDAFQKLADATTNSKGLIVISWCLSIVYGSNTIYVENN